MIPKECKRLAEVDFPIAVVSKHSVWEKKNFPRGHPSSLHQWWARRPLGACRAMLLGLLLPDPCDEHCPEDFKTKARALLARTQGQIDADDKGLREAMLGFIGDFAAWEISSSPTYLEIARGLVKAAHPEETPLVVDPFAGGGSIPLEALRIGCEAFASDLNPVACLILKVMLEDIPRHGPELAEELRRVGGEIKKQAEKELAEFYPKDPDGATPIAYLWARTVKCESPNCGAEIPLMRSFWLCKKANRKRALRYSIARPANSPPRVEFEFFEPKSERDVPQGTVTRGNATCPSCNMVLPVERVRAQLAEQRGGADTIFDQKGNRIGGAMMTAVVTVRPGEKGRQYRLPTERDYQSVWKAQKRLKAILDDWERGGRKGLCPVPNEPLPPIGTLGFRVQRYGMLQWGHLFTARQNVVLTWLYNGVAQLRDVQRDAAECLSLSIGKLIGFNSAQCAWNITNQNIAGAFGRQALPIVWDFAEAPLIGPKFVTLEAGLRYVHRVVTELSKAPFPRPQPAQVDLVDAAEHPLPDRAVSLWFTDPPYYNAVPYPTLCTTIDGERIAKATEAL